MTLQNSQIRISSTNDIEQLERKIDSLTKSLSKPYFNKILKQLLKKNLENANIICDYIIAEEVQIPSPSHVNHDFSYNKVIQVKLNIHIIFILKLYQSNIETINYKGKNPQVNLMGSNPTS